MNTPEQAVIQAARSVLQDKVHAEARKRHMNDATQSGYEHHVVVVAAEHGARAVLAHSKPASEGLREALESIRDYKREPFQPDGQMVEAMRLIARAALRPLTEPQRLGQEGEGK